MQISGRRVYEEGTVDRLLVIAFAKEAGFTLREIKQLFNGFAAETPAGVRWQKLATAKLAEMEALAARGRGNEGVAPRSAAMRLRRVEVMRGAVAPISRTRVETCS
jgi:DNA-binding transcriptional MerR regulator